MSQRMLLVGSGPDAVSPASDVNSLVGRDV